MAGIEVTPGHDPLGVSDTRPRVLANVGLGLFVATLVVIAVGFALGVDLLALLIVGMLLFAIFLRLSARAHQANLVAALKLRYPTAVAFAVPADRNLRETLHSLMVSYALPQTRVGWETRLAVAVNSSGIMVWALGKPSSLIVVCPARDVLAVLVGQHGPGHPAVPHLTFILATPSGEVHLAAAVKDATRDSIQQTRDAAERALGVVGDSAQ